MNKYTGHIYFISLSTIRDLNNDMTMIFTDPARTILHPYISALAHQGY